MGRMLAILGLAVLAACDKDEPIEDSVILTIVNDGTEAVYGKAEGYDGDEDHEFSLDPGGSITFEVWVSEELKVWVWRTSDSFLLFGDYWDSKDLDRMDERVTITIAP